MDQTSQSIAVRYLTQFQTAFQTIYQTALDRSGIDETFYREMVKQAAA